jgi:hypothetical protein
MGQRQVRRKQKHTKNNYTLSNTTYYNDGMKQDWKHNNTIEKEKHVRNICGHLDPFRMAGPLQFVPVPPPHILIKHSRL